MLPQISHGILMQIDQKTLVQTGFKSEVTEKFVSLFTKKKEGPAIDRSTRFIGEVKGKAKEFWLYYKNK